MPKVTRRILHSRHLCARERRGSTLQQRLVTAAIGQDAVERLAQRRLTLCELGDHVAAQLWLPPAQPTQLRVRLALVVDRLLQMHNLGCIRRRLAMGGVGGSRVGKRSCVCQRGTAGRAGEVVWRSARDGERCEMIVEMIVEIRKRRREMRDDCGDDCGDPQETARDAR